MLREKTRTFIILLLVLLAAAAVTALALVIYLQSSDVPPPPCLADAAEALSEAYSRQWADSTIKEANKALRLEQERLREERILYLDEVHSKKLGDLLILVNPWNPVPEGYEPELQAITDRAYTDEDHYVDVRCAENLTRMMSDCASTGCGALICSSYRTEAYQQMLYYNKIQRVMAEGYPYDYAPEIAAKSVAVPGTSEHQLGLAVDIIDVDYPYLDEYQEYTDTQAWLMENSWKYGFILRYPNGTTDITGIIYEPWHYRYVGLYAAEKIHEAGITLEEYLGQVREINAQV